MALLQTFQRNMPPYSGYLRNFDNIAHFRIVSSSQKRKQDVPPKCWEYRLLARGASVPKQEEVAYAKRWEITNFHMGQHPETSSVSRMNVHESLKSVTTFDVELKLPLLFDFSLVYTCGSCIPVR
jgi:hypothetical protein